MSSVCIISTIITKSKDNGFIYFLSFVVPVCGCSCCARFVAFCLSDDGSSERSVSVLLDGEEAELMFSRCSSHAAVPQVRVYV